MATPGTLTITDQSDRIHLDGEIDLAASSQLVDHLEAACQPGVDLLIDMTEVTFIDSTGLGALIHIAKQCRASHGEVRITNWPPVFRKMLEITGVGSFFRLDET